MLGRQQIAGVPTAISELFKNAHDAYADRVEVDFYERDALFVLRDDGIGMTREEFETRWLTLGTESKSRTETKLGRPPVDPGKDTRPVLGEKGIGRLAIAAIGPQVLILTQAERDGKAADLVAAYIHWGLFEITGIDLDQVVIPLRTFSPYTLPTTEDLDSMAGEVEKMLKGVDTTAQPEIRKAIEADLVSLRRLDPSDIETYVTGMDLHEGRGTHFLIPNADRSLVTDISDIGGEDAPNLEKLLLGFTNTMTPGHAPPLSRRHSVTTSTTTTPWTSSIRHGSLHRRTSAPPIIILPAASTSTASSLAKSGSTELRLRST